DGRLALQGRAATSTCISSPRPCRYCAAQQRPSSSPDHSERLSRPSHSPIVDFVSLGTLFARLGCVRSAPALLEPRLPLARSATVVVHRRVLDLSSPRLRRTRTRPSPPGCATRSRRPTASSPRLLLHHLVPLCSLRLAIYVLVFLLVVRRHTYRDSLRRRRLADSRFQRRRQVRPLSLSLPRIVVVVVTALQCLRATL
ncbi:uncharacterized protein RHOBADRAFT_50592, partial [Rhodotorula graminis WP1]